MEMMQEHDSVKQMWRAYLLSIGQDNETTDLEYEAWHFCDNEKDADELAELVCRGIKKATTGLLYFYELENEPLPKAGNLNIVTDWQGKARCVIRTKKVMLLLFRDVTEEFAYTEGEGDKSLNYWREAHIAAFGRHLGKLGMEFRDDMTVVCEEFEVVYM